MAEAPRPSEIFNAAQPRYFTIDPGRPFLMDLARGLTKALGRDPLKIADAEILVPTRRAVRALGDAFQQCAKEEGIHAAILPRIKPLGDVDEDALSLFVGVAEDEADFPPAISSMERKLILARMVVAKDRAFAGQESWPAALGAATELAKLLDSFYTEEIDFNALKSIVPEQFADHWSESLKFLEIVTEMWPAHLNAINRMDPADRRAKLISAQANRWKKNPPAHPVIIAGTTGSAPSVARLMKTVASLDKGAVILPGLDHTLAAEKGWNAIDDPHPQAGLKGLLKELGVEPPQVLSWPESGAVSNRSSLLSLALRPASATDDWRDLVSRASATDPKLTQATSGLSLINASDEEEEASAVALLMREALETPDETAMLVTPDRDLSRRVAAKMRRWGVIVDDSAGIPFHNSPCGTYLRLVAEWLGDRNNPIALISLAHHFLASFGLDHGAASRAVNALDQCLRGLKPAGEGVDSIKAKLEKSKREDLTALANATIATLTEAEAVWPASKEASFEEYLEGHLRAAEIVASAMDETGAERLWRGEDGEAGAMLIADLREAASAIGSPSGDYPAIFSQLISGATVRRRAPAHPRLSILGPLEARLQTADLVILGGLNEGVWPGDAMADPFLSRPMRAEIGLPSPERRIGLAAHDFAQLTASGRVALTRAARSGGAPTKPSRWLLRLRNILTGAQALEDVEQSARYAHLANSLDAAKETTPAKAPNFAPPREARPDTLFVTRIGQLLRDPYGVYAAQVLKIKKLDTLGEAFAARHLGELFHRIFEDFTKPRLMEMPENASDILRASFNELAPHFGYDVAQDTFWRAYVEETLDWFATFHAERLEKGRPAVIEGEGTLENAIAGETFTLKARADRIDLTKDNKIDVFDYKSKKMPSFKQIKSDFNPQLPLTALIAERGGFEGLNAAAISGFHYLRFLQRLKDEKKNQSGADGADALEAVHEAELGLHKLIEHYNNAETPYLSQPRPEFTDDWGDYDHLARRREWSAEEDAS